METTMKNLIIWIRETYNLTSIPVRIMNEKRWESMDEIIVREPFEGMPQRVALDEKFGVIIYDWDEVSEEIKDAIKAKYHEYAK